MSNAYTKVAHLLSDVNNKRRGRGRADIVK